MHLGDPLWTGDLEGVLARSRDAGVDGWCAVGADPAALDATARTARSVGARLALGLHPWFVDRAPVRDVLDAVERLAPDALGEIGLDRLRPGFEDAQPAALREQLAWARDRDLPVVLHCVRAHGELLTALRQVGLPRPGGVIHGWTADAPALAPFLALGLHVGLGHAVHRSARALRAAASLPADRILLESDGPPGEPADLARHAAAVGRARGEDAAHVLARAGDRARALFGG